MNEDECNYMHACYMHAHIAYMHVNHSINKSNKQRKRRGFLCLPSLVYLPDQISLFPSHSLSLSPCTFLSQLIIKKSISKVVVNLSIYQSINQSRDQSSNRIFIREEKRDLIEDVILFNYTITGPPPSFRAALLCSVQHL